MTQITMKTIASKVDQGIRLSEADALWMYEHSDLTELGQLANRVNLQKNGRAVFYNVNRHINPTNICSLSCKFCAYSKKIGEPGGYAYEIDEMIVKAGEAIAQGATELHMVGGLHPRWNFQRYVDMIAAMRKAYPEVHLKAFTAVELDWMARKARKTIPEVIHELRDAGLNSFPGGGAEIFHEEVRDAICETKVSGDQWIDIHRTAHNLGMRSNCTMLYGHIERFEHRVDHMKRLRALQDETKGFNVFIPLAFQPFQNEMGISRYSFGADDLRTIAIARLYLDNFKHIKSYWVMLGQDIAQLALHFGANDLDGTVLEEKISRAAGGQSGMIMTRSNLVTLIRRSGRLPVERTTLYDPIRDEDRVKMTPVADDHCESVAPLIAQLLSGEALESGAIQKIATEASLQQLAQAVRDQRAGRAADMQITESITVAADTIPADESANGWLHLKLAEGAAASIADYPSAITVVLDATKRPASMLHSLLALVHTAAPHSDITVRGLNTVRSALQIDHERLGEGLSRLKNHGVCALEQCRDEQISHSDDWTSFLATASALEIPLTFNLSIDADEQQVDWLEFSRQLTAAKALMRTGSSWVRFQLIGTEGSGVVMPSEFMKALALTRLSLGPTAFITTPLTGVSSLAPTTGLGADRSQHPVMKLLSVLNSFGSSGIGAVELSSLSAERIYEDLLANGRRPTLTTGALAPTPVRADKEQRLKTIRHVQPLRVDPRV